MGKYDQFLAGLPQGGSVGSGKYDQYTADLSQKPANQTEQSNGLRDALSRIPGLAEKLAPVIPGIEPLVTAAKLKPTAEEIHAGFPKVAGAMAEKLGGMGVPDKVSAATTLPVAIAPEIASSALGIGEVVAGQGPLAQAIRNSPRMISKRYDAINEAAGISRDLPIRRGSIPKFPGLDGLPTNAPPPQAPMVAPKSYPNETNAFLNFARARLEGLGQKLSAQELNDYKSMLNTAMNEGKIARGTDQYAVATQLKKKASELLSQAVPGREDLDQIYALSKKLRIAPEVAKAIWNYVGPKMRWGSILVP